MLTIDRLIEILMTEETDDAGMRAVVRALRDEVSKHDYLREVDFMFNEILGDAGTATAGAIQPQGEESVRHISQEASPPETRRRAVAGPTEGPGNGAARDDQRSGTHPRAVAREDQAGRGRHVGGEGHHCLNEKVAGGSTREESGTDEKRGSKPLRKDGAEVSPRLPDPATDPCPRCGYPAQDQCDSPGCNIDPAPAVCVWEGGNWDWVSDCGAVQEDPPLTSSCLYCGLPIKFTEAQR